MDLLILQYLRGKKFSLEKTKQKLDDFFTLRGAMPEVFSGTDPENARIAAMLKVG
jgi:hypothetical protein